MAGSIARNYDSTSMMRAAKERNRKQLQLAAYDLHRYPMFISEDPIGLAGGINMYTYAGNDPVNSSDPMGLQPDCPTCFKQDTLRVITRSNPFGFQSLIGLLPRRGPIGGYYIPDPIVGFSAGVGDALLLGTGPLLRSALNIEAVDRCSASYSAGGWSTMALGLARVAYAGAAKGISMVAASGAEASAMRETLKSLFRLGRGRGFGQPNLARYGTDDELRAAAGRTNPYVNAYGAGVGAAGVVGGVGVGCQ